jgi:DNA replication licensing factor MCM7
MQLIKYNLINISRLYISKAKKYQPLIPANVGDYAVNAYVHLRGRSAELADFQYTSARTLLSIIRLSTALVMNFF